jgi:hypothetical protein
MPFEVSNEAEPSASSRVLRQRAYLAASCANRTRRHYGHTPVVTTRELLQPTRTYVGWRRCGTQVTASQRVKTQTVQRDLQPHRPAPGRPLQPALMQRTSEPWTTAQPDATASSRTRHRSQERVQPWQPAMVDFLHTSGVVSRVPCSSLSAQALGTGRNTYLNSSNQKLDASTSWPWISEAT